MVVEISPTSCVENAWSTVKDNSKGAVSTSSAVRQHCACWRVQLPTIIYRPAPILAPWT